jgi:hypothetical protein
MQPSPPLKHLGTLILANRPKQHRRPCPRNVRRSPDEVREGVGTLAGELETDGRLCRDQPAEPARGRSLGPRIALVDRATAITVDQVSEVSSNAFPPKNEVARDAAAIGSPARDRIPSRVLSW